MRVPVNLSYVALGALAFAVITVRGDAAAQGAGEPPLTSVIEREDGTLVPLGARTRGFNLFAESDLAGTGMKLTGRYRFAQFNAGGLCSFAGTAGDLYNSACGSITGTGGGSRFFHLQSAWGVPISQYRKIREVWPRIADMQAPIGYSTPWRMTAIQPAVIRIAPADGQFGTYFSGVTSEVGAGCREMSGVGGANFPGGMALTAASDCPETWSNRGFEGIRVIPHDAWLEQFRRDPTGFRWDDWRIAPGTTADAPVLGNMATYGAFSDHSREVLAQYGSVTPFGSGPPTERGFPLGITVRYDAFRFDRPVLRDGVFIRWYVINRSADVWGRGIDYDSLYMGVDPGYIPTAKPIYNSVASGAHVITYGNLSGRCSGTYPRRVPPGATTGCASGTFRMAHFIMMLKSPIGDIRNKLFTRPESDFFAPGHPKADDTITFNHWRFGTFGLTDRLVWRYNDRALFGFMAGDEDRFLDGRAPDFLSHLNTWRMFHYEFTDGTNAVRNWKWNRSVPGAVPGYGSWDYNDDGVQDTLRLPDCGVRGCAALWSDTIAGGFSNSNVAGNITNFLGVGPFSLKAGDTTSFVWFLGTAGDTLEMNRLLHTVTDFYLDNYRAAVPYAPVTIDPSAVQLTSAWQRDSADTAGTEVRLRLHIAPPRDDPYYARVLTRLLSDDPTAVTLRRLNPKLIETVRGRMARNLAEVLVFKSCDRGVTWTADGSCTASASAFATRGEDGSPAGLGWRPRFILRADTITGLPASSVVTDLVQAGREYLYSTVTRTRGVQDIVVTTELTVDASGAVVSEQRTSLAEAFGIDGDTITSALARSGPTAVTMYAPLTETAGSVLARIDTMTVQGYATPRINAVAGRRDVQGTYRLRFGNRFVITRTVDTVTEARTSTVIRQSVYPRVVLDPALPSVADFVASADTFAAAHWPHVTANLSTSPASMTGTRKVFIDTVVATNNTFVLAETAGSGNAPLFVATTVSTSTSALEGSSLFPGFTVRWATDPSPVTWILNQRGDSITPDGESANAVRQGLSDAMAMSAGGHYRIRWLDDPFGPDGPFDWTPATLRSAVDSSLRRRKLGTITTTDQAVRGLRNYPGGVQGIRPLVAASVPFRVITPAGDVADLVMMQRHATGNVIDSVLRNSLLLGTDGDTMRVSVPPNAWMPGDTLFVVEVGTTDMLATPSTGGVYPLVHDTVINGRTQRLPVQVPEKRIGLRLVLACESDVTPRRITCNPIRTGAVGATNYLPMADGWQTHVRIRRPFDQNSDVLLTAIPHVTAGRRLTVTDTKNIFVVPNPYVVMSAYDVINANRITTAPRVMFVNVPAAGVLRVYSVSGQLMRQQAWTPADLTANDGATTHGDLPFELRTTDGNDIGPGLYVYVLTGKSPNAAGVTARGKFVVIR